MKKQGLLNADIAAVTASMGHLDTITIADAGLPIPDEAYRIDLVVKKNLPRFLDVVSVLLDELVVQEAIVAAEMAETSPALYDELHSLLGEIPITFMPHEEFKARTAESKAVVRSGEFTPYANVILVSGVDF